MSSTTALSALSLVVVVVAGCAPAAAVAPPSTPPATNAPASSKTDFDRALASFTAHDAAHDWTDASCKEVARRFEAIGTPPAWFDAALAYQRCGHVDDGIRALEKAVTDGKFQDAPPLVALARLQMVRDGATPEAKRNVQRALAIDDSSMTAYDQLAQWYLKAKRLDLAALVCSQAIKKNASYAPIHNTAGLVENELGRVNAALAEFATARRLDPNLFEAHMSYATVNLGFRGFEQAREAFARALALRPNDYDAHLGMALALRGPLTGMEPDLEARIDAVQAELDAAKKIDPNRPDAYYNEGILTQEFKAKAGGATEKTIAELEKAKAMFQTFLGKAAGKAKYDGAVKRVKGDGSTKDLGRMRDIDETIAFLKLDVNAQRDQANRAR